MEINNETYWKKYWKEEINKNRQTDYLADNWLNDYKSILEKIKDKKALDLGCGVGQDTKYLLKQGFKVISTDISNEALDKLKSVIPNSHVEQIDMTKPFPFEEEFGLVNANLSIHYFDWKTTKQIFSEVNRILKKEGIFVGRVNSDKIEGYNIEQAKKIEDHFYYNVSYNKFYRLFNQKQFEELTKEWKILVLKENITVRADNKKALWEFIFQK